MGSSKAPISLQCIWTKWETRGEVPGRITIVSDNTPCQVSICSGQISHLGRPILETLSSRFGEDQERVERHPISTSHQPCMQVQSWKHGADLDMNQVSRNDEKTQPNRVSASPQWWDEIHLPGTIL